MVEYNNVNIKLSDLQQNEPNSIVKSRAKVTLRISMKMFNGNNLPHELLLTRRQTAKLRNAFENNMSTDIKLSKAQISKIVQSGGFLSILFRKLAGPLMKLAVA